MVDYKFAFDSAFNAPLTKTGRVEKYNRFHDRVGRFASHGAHMDTGHGAPTDHAREGFKEIMKPYLARMSGHGTPGERDIHEMHVEIEAGGKIRDEIDRRTVKLVASPEYVQRHAELSSVSDRAATEYQLRDSMPVEDSSWNARWQAERQARSETYRTSNALTKAVRESPVYERLRSERDTLQQERDSVVREIDPIRERLSREFIAREGHKPGFQAYQAELKFINDNLPSHLVERRTKLQEELNQVGDYIREAHNVGETHASVYGRGQSDTPSKKFQLSPDNPFRIDAEYMRRVEEHDASRAAYRKAKGELRRAQSEPTASQALYQKYIDAQKELKSFELQSRRGVITEVLGDAGVKFSDGKVALRGKFPSAIMDDVNDGNAIRTTSSKRSKAITSLEKVAPYIPARWVQHSPTIDISWNSNGRGFHSSGKIQTASNNTTLHEMIHSAEATVPGFTSFEKEFYQYRTGGAETQKLSKLQPGLRYRSHEISIPDKFYDAYCGKSYGGRAYELMTMGYADLMFPRGAKRIDPEYEAWVWAVIMRTS
jgi:hypothetical protein